MVNEKRGKNTALIGAILSLVFAAVLGYIWLWTGSEAAMATMWLVAGGVSVWLMAALLFYCRQLAAQEEQELQDLAAQGGAEGTIFKDDKEFRPARRRVAWVDRWLVPAFTLLWAAYHGAFAWIILRMLSQHPAMTLESPGLGALFLMLICFVAFLFSFYCMGMAKVAQWRLLRATGGFLLVNVLFIFLTMAALVAWWANYRPGDRIVAYAVPVFQAVLAVELLLNFVLERYRPQMPDQEHRYSFDSRLLNMIAEPGRMGHSIAEALNYQFGFEVSKTWFYQLISRAAVPFIILAVLILMAMSSFVLVYDGQQAVVRRLGQLQGAEGKLGPGLHVKWPWPIETIETFNIGRVHEMLLGAGEEQDIQKSIIKGHQIALWTAEHGARKELDFLIAVSPRQQSQRSGVEKPPPPVNIIKLVVSVQYLVKDALKFSGRFTDAPKVLECLANREMTAYCASATLDSPVGNADALRPEAIMTYGRVRAAEEMKKRIQAIADKLDLGVEITFVGLLSVHPPAKVAPEFENVLRAERGQEADRFRAEADMNRILAEVAGTPVQALRLALAIRTHEELTELTRVQRQGPEFQEKLNEYLAVAKDHLQGLEKEVEHERMMGKLRSEDQTRTQELQAEYRKHLDLLVSIPKDNPAGFDFAKAIASAEQEADELFAKVAGRPSTLVEQAKAYRWNKEMTERSRWEAFSRELLAYEASPRIYMLDRWLDVWDDTLPNIHKYVMAVPNDQVEFWLDLKREAGLEAYQNEPTLPGVPAAKPAE